MESYPTRQGIAVSPNELYLPYSRDKRRNNHHAEFSERVMGRTAVTLALRNLERHQYVMPIDTHDWLHRKYSPPALPTLEQAVREVMDAYDQGEMFKIKGHGGYHHIEIPLEMVDRFMREHNVRK